MITVVIGTIIPGSLYLGGPTIQEVDGKMMMGLSVYGVAVISGSLYSRFYGICIHGQSIWSRVVPPPVNVQHANVRPAE